MDDIDLLQVLVQVYIKAKYMLLIKKLSIVNYIILRIFNEIVLWFRLSFPRQIASTAINKKLGLGDGMLFWILDFV